MKHGGPDGSECGERRWGEPPNAAESSTYNLKRNTQVRPALMPKCLPITIRKGIPSIFPALPVRRRHAIRCASAAASAKDPFAFFLLI